jgi:hypothetical protein
VLIQVAERVWPPAAVHDTVAAVADQLLYRRNLRQSIAERIMEWLVEALTWVMRQLGGTGIARPLGFAFVALVVLVLLVRLVVASRARDDGQGSRARRIRGEPGEDPFRAAEQLASEGRFEEAAHALYRGVLRAVARGERLRLDPSKTSGDYARELRARGSSAYQPFRSFARRFDAGVYGHGPIDAALIADLRRLAAPFVPRASAG